MPSPFAGTGMSSILVTVMNWSVSTPWNQLADVQMRVTLRLDARRL